MKTIKKLNHLNVIIRIIHVDHYDGTFDHNKCSACDHEYFLLVMEHLIVIVTALEHLS